ncbi:MAG: hypothetical protein WBF33_12150 [Candidatus Nitrosopolaris sp.]
MGRITPSFRQLYEETVSELKMESSSISIERYGGQTNPRLSRVGWICPPF